MLDQRHSKLLDNKAADLERDAIPSAQSGGYRLAALARTELLGLCDHAFVSGANFITIVVVSRAMSPSDFGFFVLAFTVILTTLTLQGALITRPHNVLAAVRRDDVYANYSTTAAVAQLAFTGALAALCMLSAGIFHLAGSTRALSLVALSLALVTWQLQEFSRRILYTERRLAGALASDVLSYGGAVALLVLVWRLDGLTVTRVFMIFAIAFAVGAVASGVQVRVALSGKLDSASLSASWQFGRWLGLAEVGQWFSTQFVYYLAAAVLGAAASGAIKAGQTLLGPCAAFLAFFTSYLPIVFAQELERSKALNRKVRWSFGAILPIVIAYSALTALFSEQLLEIVYGPEYSRYASVVELFAVYYVVVSVSTVAVAVLSARGMTRRIFSGHAAGAAVFLAVGWVLVEAWGAAGGVAAMLASVVAATGIFIHASGVGNGVTRG